MRPAPSPLPPALGPFLPQEVESFGACVRDEVKGLRPSLSWRGLGGYSSPTTKRLNFPGPLQNKEWQLNAGPMQGTCQQNRNPSSRGPEPPNPKLALGRETLNPKA